MLEDARKQADAFDDDSVPPGRKDLTELLTITIEVVLMTWWLMPVLTRRLARWIYPGPAVLRATDASEEPTGADG